jgi:hypothetical protein
MAKLRVSLGLNAGPKGGQGQFVAVVEATGPALLTAAANKLRLKKKDLKDARLFVWKTGAAVDAASPDVRALVSDGDLVVVALNGEAFGGKTAAAAAFTVDAEDTSSSCRLPAEEAGLLWEARSENLAVVEWASASTMNRALGRVSTLLEHPTHCGGALVRGP